MSERLIAFVRFCAAAAWQRGRFTQSPTLLLAGAEDNMTPFKPGDSGAGFAQIQKLMPDNRLVVLPDCGHYPVIEQPALACAEIVKFIG